MFYKKSRLIHGAHVRQFPIKKREIVVGWNGDYTGLIIITFAFIIEISEYHSEMSVK